MLHDHSFTPDQAAIERAWARWEKNAGYAKRDSSVSFTVVYQLFGIYGIQSRHIAKILNVSITRVSQIYNEYFRALFNGMSLDALRRVLKLEQTKSEFLRPNSFVAVIADKARAAGCIVEPVPAAWYHSASRGQLTKRMFINGNLCTLRYVRRRSQPRTTENYYAHIEISTATLNSVDAVVVYIDIDGYPHRLYCVPVEDLRAAYPDFEEREFIGIYIPLEPFPRNPRKKPLIDYAQYEDRWPLLGSKPNLPAP